MKDMAFALTKTLKNMYMCNLASHMILKWLRMYSTFYKGYCYIYLQIFNCEQFMKVCELFTISVRINGVIYE